MNRITLCLMFFFLLIGCRPSEKKDDFVDENQPRTGSQQQFKDTENLKKAIAVLQPAADENIKGTVTFTLEGTVIRVVADVSGLKPGLHGIHIHELGDCSAPDFSSAGAHFSPVTHNHGAPTVMDRHTGDLGNVLADASGFAHLELTDSVLSFTGMNSIIGRSVVVHEMPDDFMTQPSGNSGMRIACGVIGISKQ